MKTILVPTDFSATASNAAHYAVHLAKQVNCHKIILYNAYQVPVITDAVMTPVELVGIEEMREVSEQGLEKFRQQLQDYAGPESDITLDTVSDFALLAESIDDVCKEYQIDLIVMGITGGNKVEEVLIGSNTISVARHTTVPVIIVPADVEFTPIREIVLACDFKKVVETTPVAPIKKILDETGAKLFVLNIDHNRKHQTGETVFESLLLDTLLQGYNPEYHFADSPDFVEGINHFVSENKVDLIITIPKKHGIFESLFKRSHTKMLAYHSHVPLVVLHD
ncbi:universal stress protein [Foetidibacter luteolus]|uniref:universal stress protein n=1 Tax=Foetidibacter luteolus TaxID=2608880 RepID=UPI00129A0ED0|nr:universal stress protein [Foetidibacter luteolus]